MIRRRAVPVWWILLWQSGEDVIVDVDQKRMKE